MIDIIEYFVSNFFFFFDTLNLEQIEAFHYYKSFKEIQFISFSKCYNDSEEMLHAYFEE